MRHQKLIILFSLLITACSGSQNTPTAELNRAQDATQKVEGSNPTQPIPETQKVEGSNPTQQAPTFNPKAYDVQCADNILGMEVTDQIFPEICAEECRNPTEDELRNIETCRNEATAKQSPTKQQPSNTEQVSNNLKIKPTSVVDTMFELDNYRGECIAESLGGDIGAQIRFEGRPPTPDELIAIEDCLKESFNPEEYNLQCADNILGMEVTDQIFPELCAEECRNPTEVELEQIEACRSGVPLGSHDDGGQEAPVYSQRECARDSRGMAVGPDCNVPPTPLPAGVVIAELLDAQPPQPNHEFPETYECEIVDEFGKCAELRWEAVSDLLAGEFTAIEIAPTNSDILYAGVDSNDMSIYKSVDAGATWQLFDVTGHTGGVAINPVDPNIVLYTNLEAPIRRTADGGWRWESVLSVITDTGATPWTAIAFSPDDPNIAYTANVPGPSRGGFYPPEPANIYVSNNAGLGWSLVGTCECGAIKRLVVQPNNSDVVWAAGDGGVRVSRDGGQKWSEDLLQDIALRPEGATESSSMGLALHHGDPSIILAATTEVGMFRSTDGGKTWSATNDGIDTKRLHHVVFAPSQPDIAYVATHQGVYRSDDAGQSWTPTSQTMTYPFVTAIAVDPNNADIAYVGTASEVYTSHTSHFNPGLHEGEGLYKTNDGGKTWSRSDKGIYEAKVAQMGTHPLIPFNLWAGGESGRGAFFTPDGGESWLFSPFQGAHYPMVFAFSQTFPTLQYLTAWTHFGELSKSTDGGSSWFLLTSKIESGISEETRSLGLILDEEAKFHLHGLAIAPSDPDIIYVGSVHDSVYPDVGFTLFGAHLFKSINGGKSFTEMSNGFPIETRTAINAIVVHPDNPDVAYAMTTRHESETAIGIYKTINGARSWTAVNEGIDPQTNDLQIDPLSPDTLYAATEAGVYKTTDGANTWKHHSEGIPAGPVIDLALDPINPLMLYAITPEHVYRTKDGGDHWYQVDLGLPLDDSSDAVTSGKSPSIDLGESEGHRVYGGYFAQDRTLEIDATGRLLYVVVKTSRHERSVRHVYRAILGSLLPVSYQFELQGEKILVQSTSNVYEMIYENQLQELRFTVAGPSGTNGRTTITIPDKFLDGKSRVLVDGYQVPASHDGSDITFEYTHIGRSTVIISNE